MGNALTANVVGTGVDTLTLTANTKFLVIEGSTADKVFEGTADDIVYDSTNTANNSRVVMSRAGITSGTTDYYQAAYVYIIR